MIVTALHQQEFYPLVLTHPYLQRTKLSALGLSGCRTLLLHLEAGGDWQKHQGFHWIKHCMPRPKCSSLQLAVPWVFSSEGKEKQVLQTHCGDLKKQLKLHLHNCLGIPCSQGNISIGISCLLYYCTGFTGQNTNQPKKIIAILLEKALLWLNCCTIPAHFCLCLTENTILRLSCIFPSKGVNAGGKRKDPLTTEKLSNAVSQRSCLFIFTGATDVCLVFSAHPSINLKTTHTWTYDTQLSAPR